MAARVHVTDTYDVPDTDDADADTDDDAGPCEDIVVLAKTHSGASEDTYCGSDDDDDDRLSDAPEISAPNKKDVQLYTKILSFKKNSIIPQSPSFEYDTKLLESEIEIDEISHKS